jgi:homoserine O-succinyltransferase
VLTALPLAARGYSVLTHSDTVGVDMFVKEQGSLFVFFQGHPEYDEGALLREYRRDIGRYLRGERDTYPAAPHGYFDETSKRKLDVFQARAMAERSESIIDDFPEVTSGHRRRSGRDPATVQIYRNWLTHVAQQKAARTKSRSSVDVRTNRPAASEAVPG